MRPATIVLTNDDGIEAVGLAALREAAATALPGARLVTVAPDRCHSQCGHAFITDRPLTLRRIGEEGYACDGTPVDCVRLALFGLGLRPDLVLSGINHGGNLGHDLAASGTVAAAREAAWHGVTAVALSHYRRRGFDIDWQLAARRVAHVLEQLLDPGHVRDGGLLRPGEHASVNLPHTRDASAGGGIDTREPRLVECRPEPAPLPVGYEQSAGVAPDLTFQYNGSYGDRPRRPGSDVDVCFGGDISWCRLNLPI